MVWNWRQWPWSGGTQAGGTQAGGTQAGGTKPAAKYTQYQLSRIIILSAFFLIGGMLIIHYVTVYNVITNAGLTTITTKGGVINKTTSTNAVAISNVLDRLDRSNQTLFNILLPVFGAWVGVVIAFYFGSEQAKKAQDVLIAQTKALGGAAGGPTVVSTFPSDGSPVPVDSKFAATFSEPVTVEANSITLKDIKNTLIPGTTSLSQDGKTLEFKPSAKLDPSTTYIATITGVKDLAGNSMSASKTWIVTTA